jgi:hypothetical protein
MSERTKNTTLPPNWYKGLCIQFDDSKDRHGTEYWWVVSHSFMTFLMATHIRSTESPANKLAGLEPMLRNIHVYLFPKNDFMSYRFCMFAPCAFPSCKFSICTEHGHGNACDEGDGSFDSFSYEVPCCMECDNHYCWNHNNETVLTYCEVCINESSAARNLGCYNSVSGCILCPKHKATRCEQLIENGAGDYDAEEGDETRDGTVCGFMCCQNCLEEHTCGEDPTDYC